MKNNKPKNFKEFLETASADIAQVDTKLKLDEECNCTPDLICEVCQKKIKEAN